MACRPGGALRGYILLAADRVGVGGRGREMEEKEIWMISVILQTSTQQQGPWMNNMHVFKYESAKDLAKSIFCNAYLHPTQFGPMNF